MKVYKKYQSLSTPVKATFWFTMCNFLLKGISFITVPLFAKYLSTEQYGIVSIYNSYQQIFMIFATLELSMGAYQRGILKFKNDLKLYTQSVQLTWSTITAILFILVLCFKDLFIHLTETNITILTLMFVYFLVQPAYECWINEKRFKYNYKSVVFSTIIFSLLTTFIPLLCVIYIKQTAIVRIFSVLVIQILFCSPFYFKNIKLNSLVDNKYKVTEFVKFALKFQLPLVLHSLSFLILAQSDRIMIGEMVGKSEAALYSVAYSLANVVIIFQTSINQVLKPWRYQKMESKDYKSINNISNILLIVLGVLVLIFILVAPEVMKILFNTEYYEAIWSIPPIALSIYFMFLYSIFADIESYFYKTHYIMYASVMCAILNIILNFFGISYFGYIACGYTTLISYIFFSISHYWFMNKSCKDNEIIKPIFNVKFLIFISLIFIVLTILFALAYPHIVVRVFIFILIIGVCFCLRNKLILTFKILVQKG